MISSDVTLRAKARSSLETARTYLRGSLEKTEGIEAFEGIQDPNEFIVRRKKD